MDFLTKEMVGSYCWNNLKTDRSFFKESVVNGRKQYVCCENCAVTMVAFVYKVFDPSVKRSKFVVNIGISRQHPCDKLNKKLGVEVASEYAMISPSMSLTFDTKPSSFEIKRIMENHYNEMPLMERKTNKEIKEMEFNSWISLNWYIMKFNFYLHNPSIMAFPHQNINILW